MTVEGAAAIVDPQAAGAEEPTRCKHLLKGLRMSNLRNAVPHMSFASCSDCPQAIPLTAAATHTAAGATDSGEKNPPKAESQAPKNGPPADISESIWICLCCGKQSCGRTLKGHAVSHFETTKHPLSFQVTSQKCWCYACDEFLEVRDYPELETAQEYMMRFAKKKLKSLEGSSVVTHATGNRLSKLSLGDPAEPVGSPSATGKAAMRKGRKGKAGGEGVFFYDAKEAGSVGKQPDMMSLLEGPGDEDHRKRAISPGIHGLQNLGNTCFFNSVIQAMTHTTLLQERFSSPPQTIESCLMALEASLTEQIALKAKEAEASGEGDANQGNATFGIEENPNHAAARKQEEEKLKKAKGADKSGLGYLLDGPLTQSLIELFRMMWENNTKTLNPSQVLGEIRKKAPRFRGGQQQDSQELLRYLVDGMRSEEQKLILDGLAETLPNGKANEKYGELSKRIRTFVDDIYGGKLVSRVVCGECGTISETFEPFLDLSLSIPSEDGIAWGGSSRRKPAPAPAPANLPSKPAVSRPMSRKEQKKAEKETKKKKVLEKHARKLSTEEPKEAAPEEAKEANELVSEESKELTEKKTTAEEVGSKEPMESNNGEENEEGEEGEGVEDGEIQETPTAEVETTLLSNAPQFPSYAAPYTPKGGECSVSSCLASFCSREILSGPNKFGCAACYKKRHGDSKEKDKTPVVYTVATKQFMIKEAPRVLTLHLKRFEQRGFTMVRMSRTVEFGPTLNLGPFVTRDSVSKAEDLIYDLYAVVVHSGTLNSGHYTAYVKVTLPNKQRRWFYVSDTVASVATEANVFSCSGAYILFYERRT